MTREHVRIIYTPEDEAGFSFRDASKEERDPNVIKWKKSRKKHLLIGLCLLIPGVLIQNLATLSDMSEIAVMLYNCMIIMGVFVYVWVDNSNIRQLKKKRMLIFEVEILEKLPIENEETYGPENMTGNEQFFPIIGRDTTSGYESKCFISKDAYNTKQIGETVQIQRFIRRKK